MFEKEDYHIRKVTLKNHINVRDVTDMVNKYLFNYLFSPRKFKTRIKNFDYNVYLVPLWIISGKGSSKCLAEKTIRFTEKVNGEEVERTKTEQYQKTMSKDISWAVAAHDTKKPQLKAIKESIEDFNTPKPLTRLDWGYTRTIHQVEQLWPIKKYHDNGISRWIYVPETLIYGDYLLKSSAFTRYSIEKNPQNMSVLEQVISFDQAKEETINKVQPEIERSLRAPGEKIKDVDITYEFDKIQLVFIPMWLISYRFEGKLNYGVINGYNGEPIRILVPPSFRAGAISWIYINLAIYSFFGTFFYLTFTRIPISPDFWNLRFVKIILNILFAFPLLYTTLSDAGWFVRIIRDRR